MAESKDTNPKDAVGIKKVPFSTIPANVMGEISLGLMEGARKYGRHNYRVMGVRASVYYDAALRHLMAWWEGEDIDKDSGMSHISKALSCLVVLRDAMLNNKWNDDRPPKVKEGWVGDLNKKAGEIIEKYPEAKDPYTELSVSKAEPGILPYDNMNKEEYNPCGIDKSFTIYGPGNRLMGKFPGLKTGDRFEFGTCIYPSDNDGIAVIELTMPFTEKDFLEFEKNWKPNTFGTIKVASVFNNKAARWYKNSNNTAIVVESGVLCIGDEYEFSDTDEIILISEPQ